ncbi:MAG: HesA/MoeB/ThiF family protein [Bacteroidetes bacterium]|nr:HesA/MoeB/ThiF family protein [Bacteroidota bacterium]
MERFSNQLKIDSFSTSHQQMLANANIAMVGAGGLGCPLLLSLVQMGVGHISIFDDDVVNLSNLNRQGLFGINDIGRLKAETAVEKLAIINPKAVLLPFNERISSKNASQLLSHFHIVVDCTDNLSTRYAIDKVCSRCSIPLIFGGVRKFEGQVGVFNGMSGVSFSEIFPVSDETFKNEDCEMLGTFGFITQIIGGFQAQEVFKIVTGIGQPLWGKVVHYDLLEHQKSVVNYLM